MRKPISVLGVDLASVRWSDNGTALLTFTTGNETRWRNVSYSVISWPSRPLSAQAMAEVIDSFALQNEVKAVSLDGPQGWRDPEARDRPGVGRWCEYVTQTQGKTGPFGVTYPGTQFGWIQFCIEVFERLVEAGHCRLVNQTVPIRLSTTAAEYYYLTECFPTKTWRSSHLTPLPGKSSTRPGDVAAWAKSLWQRYGFPGDDRWVGSHDDLQAVVAALPAAALLGGPCVPAAHGNSGHWVDAVQKGTPRHWVEGLIWDATPPIDRINIPVEKPRKVLEKLTIDTKSDTENPILIDDRVDSSHGIDRGIRLFEYLVDQANNGSSVGIGYAQFACFIHRALRFQELANRQYLPSDSAHVISLAHQVTAAAGRKDVQRGTTVIRAGMDTFIWRGRPPHLRPQPAFRETPYTERDWRTVFPDGSRRLISQHQLSALIRGG